MDSQKINKAAALLVKARGDRTTIDGLPTDLRPANVAEAHAIQDATTAALSKAVAAFKAMAPANGEPTRGLIYAGTIHHTPAHLPAADVPQCGVEGEVAFEFLRDLPPRAEPYTRAEVENAVNACAAIEVVSSRYSNSDKVSVLDKLADSISNGAFVHDIPIDGWRRLDLGKIKVTLLVNGSPVLEQNGGHPTGDPLGTAVALVNMMRDKDGVRAAQFVTCGSYTGLRYLQPGDVCIARFEGLGTAEVTFTR